MQHHASIGAQALPSLALHRRAARGPRGARGRAPTAYSPGAPLGHEAEPPTSGAREPPASRAASLLRPSLAVAAALAGLALISLPACAEVPDAITDENLLSDFNVRFLGLKVDHRVIVEWVVAGQTVGFLGSLIGGQAARAGQEEVKRLNVKLLAVNKQLREQARAARSELAAAAAVAAVAAGDTGTAAAVELVSTLRAGKALLKAKDAPGAHAHFEKALALARAPGSSHSLADATKAERKALRGLGAAAQLSGQLDAALGHMRQVLALSEELGDDTGAADAMGAIADLYTDKGELDEAGKWYDRYIGAMQ